MERTIFKTEKQLLVEQMWSIVHREIGDVDTAGFDLFTTYDGKTCFGEPDDSGNGFGDVITDKAEIGQLVDSINCLEGRPHLVRVKI